MAERFVVERYEVSDDPNIAEAASAAEVLRIDQPTLSHNGGQLEFGPDGMLYISIGDGGEYEDPRPDNHRLRLPSRLGVIRGLRL